MTDFLLFAALDLILVVLAFFLGRWSVKPIQCPRGHLPVTPLREEARAVVGHVEDLFPGTSGEYRRAQALRMMMNRNPAARERECALAIELAVSE